MMPHVEIISPPDSSVLYSGSDSTLRIQAYDSDGTISKVEISTNNSLNLTLYDRPYIYSLDRIVAG